MACGATTPPVNIFECFDVSADAASLPTHVENLITCASLTYPTHSIALTDGNPILVNSSTPVDIATVDLFVEEDGWWTLLALWIWYTGGGTPGDQFHGQLVIDGNVYDPAVPNGPGPYFTLPAAACGGTEFYPYRLFLTKGTRIITTRMMETSGGSSILVDPLLSGVTILPDPMFKIKQTTHELFGRQISDPVCVVNPDDCCPGLISSETSGSGSGGGAPITWMPLDEWTNFTTQVGSNLPSASITAAAGSMLRVDATIGGPDGLTITGVTFAGVAMTLDLTQQMTATSDGETLQLVMYSMPIDVDTTGQVVISYSGPDTNTYVTGVAYEVLGLVNRVADRTASQITNATGGPATLFSGPTLTTSYANEFCAAAFAIAFNSTNVSWSGGFHTLGLDDDPTLISATSGYRILSATSSVDASISVSSISSPYAAIGGVVTYS